MADFTIMRQAYPLVETRSPMCGTSHTVGSRVIRYKEPETMPPQSVYGRLMRMLWKTHYTDLGPFRAI